MSDYDTELSRRERIQDKEIAALKAQVSLLETRLSIAEERRVESVMRLQHADWVLKEGAYAGDVDACRCCKDTKRKD